MSNDPTPGGGGREPSTSDVDVADQVAALEAAVEDLEADLEEMIEDVRARVVQVKRETDSKAAAEAHAQLAATVESDLREEVEALAEEQESIRDALDDLAARLEAGFANYEEVLEYLVDSSETVEQRLETLATAVLQSREAATRTAEREAERAAVDRLKDAAQARGTSTAKCEDCGGRVSIGLLTAPRCPHCAATFAEYVPRRFFQADRLRTGEQPALEAPTDEDGVVDLASVVRAGDRSPPTVEPSEEAIAPEGTAHRDDGQAVDHVSGIGAAYAERLRDAGIDTVDALAEADPASLADRTGIAAGRVEKWVDRARAMARAE